MNKVKEKVNQSLKRISPILGFESATLWYQNLLVPTQQPGFRLRKRQLNGL